MMDTLFPVLGVAAAVAGGDKLSGDRAYAGMFRHLGWSRGRMRAVGMAEVAGGLLMAPRTTRRLGGTILAAASGLMLLEELRHGDARLATPRGLVLLAALAAALAPGR